MNITIKIISTACLLLPLIGYADVTEDLAKLQHDWAEATYSVEPKAQKVAFETLIEHADGVVESSSDSVELLIWRGIISSTYAGVKGGLGAMKYAKSSKIDLEKAIELDDTALDGSAYLSLGILYFKVPGWPIGFGDNDKAKVLLEKGLALSPEGIDSNYFYADFLDGQGDYKEAEQYLLKAQQAPARPGRPLADKGRQQEITVLLATVQEKLQAKKITQPF